ncbi:MAG TPA: hypothetical protein VFF06_04200 [Polyangia bacterium]|nr:hypothetical protein [Polyangia bacterium]
MKHERWLPLVFLALALLALAPIFQHPSYYASAYDWRYFQSWIEVGRRSVLWFHQVPLWNPYGCGGEVLLANPQSEVASPTFVWALLFGTALGVKLMLLTYYFCAFDGMYRLARDHEASVSASLLASVLFGAGGWLALHLSSGHSNFASAALFPYLVLCYRRGREQLEWAIPLGAIAAWIIAHGGTSTPAMATVLLATVSTVDAAKRRSLKPYRVLLLGAACAFALGAARILPALEFALDHPRRQWETDSSTVFEMIKNAYFWAGLQAVPGKRYWFHEYGYRLAYVTPPLILWSAIAKKPTRAWWWVVAIGAGIVAGRAIPYGPWWLLKHLPIYRDLRVPSRYAVLLALAFPLLCAGALDDLRARVAEWRGEKFARVAAAIVVVLAAGDGVAFQWARWYKIFDLQQREPRRDVAFSHIHGSWQTMMFTVLEGHGAIACDEEAPLERALQLDEGDVPQVRLADPSAGRIPAVHWTPNRVELMLELDRPTTVMINENWNEHWKTSAGQVVRVGPKVERDKDGGRLGVEAPAGKYELDVYYRPRSFVLGASISGGAFPLLLGLWIWIRRRRRRAA